MGSGARDLTRPTPCALLAAQTAIEVPPMLTAAHQAQRTPTRTAVGRSCPPRFPGSSRSRESLSHGWVPIPPPAPSAPVMLPPGRGVSMNRCCFNWASNWSNSSNRGNRSNAVTGGNRGVYIHKPVTAVTGVTLLPFIGRNSRHPEGIGPPHMYRRGIALLRHHVSFG